MSNLGRRLGARALSDSDSTKLSSSSLCAASADEPPSSTGDGETGCSSRQHRPQRSEKSGGADAWPTTCRVDACEQEFNCKAV